jgi:succinate dehydrogenase / fumarate reductase iron-sulfur subunit
MSTSAAPTATLSVFRFDPSREEQPHYRDYTLPVKRWMTVLDALTTIKDTVDGTLTLRFSCRSAICGSCAMRINGHSVLACRTLVQKEMERHGRVIVEPMGNMPVIKDLVVDMAPFWRHMNRLKPWVISDPRQPPPEREHLMTPAQVGAFEGTPNCIVCGACHSACPAVEVDPNFPGPAALAKAYRFTVDPRDHGKQDRLEVAGGVDTWLCVRCYLCVEACPKDVRPGEMITLLKEVAVREGFKDNQGAKHALAFERNIRVHGNLNETRLLLDTLGPKALIDQLKTRGPRGALEALRKGKAPPPIQSPIPEIDEVRELYEEYPRE